MCREEVASLLAPYHIGNCGVGNIPQQNDMMWKSRT